MDVEIAAKLDPDIPRVMMAVTQGIVRAGRKAKNGTGVSLKGKNYLLYVKISTKVDPLVFGICRDDITKIASG